MRKQSIAGCLGWRMEASIAFDLPSVCCAWFAKGAFLFSRGTHFMKTPWKRWFKDLFATYNIIQLYILFFILLFFRANFMLQITRDQKFNLQSLKAVALGFLLDGHVLYLQLLFEDRIPMGRSCSINPTCRLKLGSGHFWDEPSLFHGIHKTSTHQINPTHQTSGKTELGQWFEETTSGWYSVGSLHVEAGHAGLLGAESLDGNGSGIYDPGGKTRLMFIDDPSNDLRFDGLL